MIQFTITGRVGKDAEVKDIYAVFNMASTKKGYTKKDGTVIPDKTTWVSVFCSPNLGKHIKKGQYLVVTANDIKARGYQKQDGAIEGSISLYADVVEFGGSQGQQQTTAQQPIAQGEPQPKGDLPF